MNPFQKTGLTPILEPQSSSSPQPPAPLPQASSLPPMSFDPPLPLQPRTLPSDFADSRWSEEVSQGPPLPIQSTFPVTILRLPPQQSLPRSTQMTSGTLLHPAPFYLSPPLFCPGSLTSRTPNTQPSSTGISPYPIQSQIQSLPPFTLLGKKSRRKSPDHPDLERQLQWSNLPGGSESSQNQKDPHVNESLSLKAQKSEGDLETGGQVKQVPLVPSSPKGSPMRSTSTEQVENPPTEPPSHHDTPLQPPMELNRPLYLLYTSKLTRIPEDLFNTSYDDLFTHFTNKLLCYDLFLFLT